MSAAGHRWRRDVKALSYRVVEKMEITMADRNEFKALVDEFYTRNIIRHEPTNPYLVEDFMYDYQLIQRLDIIIKKLLRKPRYRPPKLEPANADLDKPGYNINGTTVSEQVHVPSGPTRELHGILLEFIELLNTRMKNKIPQQLNMALPSASVTGDIIEGKSDTIYEAMRRCGYASRQIKYAILSLHLEYFHVGLLQKAGEGSEMYEQAHAWRSKASKLMFYIEGGVDEGELYKFKTLVKEVFESILLPTDAASLIWLHKKIHREFHELFSDWGVVVRTCHWTDGPFASYKILRVSPHYRFEHEAKAVHVVPAHSVSVEIQQILVSQSLPAPGFGDITRNLLSPFKFVHGLSMIVDDRNLEDHHLEGIGELVLLSSLRLHGPGITRLPEEIIRLEQLKTIYLKGTRVAILPTSIRSDIAVILLGEGAEQPSTVFEIRESDDVSSTGVLSSRSSSGRVDLSTDVPLTAKGDAQLGGILPDPPAPEDDDGWMAVMAQCVQWSSIISTVITAIKLVGEAVVFSVKPFGEWVHLNLSVPKEVLLCSSPESLCIMSLAALMTGFWNIYGVPALERRHARGRRFHGVLVYILKQLTKPLLVGMFVLVMFFRRLSPSVKFAMSSDAFEIFGILLHMLQRTFASLRPRIPTM